MVLDLAPKEELISKKKGGARRMMGFSYLQNSGIKKPRKMFLLLAF